MKIRKFYLCTILLLYSLSPLFSDRPDDLEGEIRVGIFPFEPINFIDENGRAQGLYPDLLREMSKDEDWTVTFVEGSWAQCLERLENEEIDLMISVAYTEERDKIMDFNYESVMEIWGQVFIRPENKSVNINHLQGRKVGIMAKDISGENFIKTASGFNIECEIIEYATHGEVFAAVQNEEVMAGVAPQHFGLRNANAFDLIPSTIQFSPFSIYFASKEGKQDLLLNYIDSHLFLWKENKDSYYYSALTYWMTGKALRRNIIPMWLVIFFSVISFIALVFLLFIVLLRFQVKKSTEKLIKQERQYRDLVEYANSIIIRINQKGHIFFVNKYGLAFIGRNKEELLGQNPLGIIFSEENDIYNWINKNQVSFIDELPISDGSSVFIQWNNKVIYDDAGILEEILCIGVDLSELKSAEKNLQETNLQLEEMVYIASHDLQVPLVSMEGYASELLENYKNKLDDEATFCLTRLQMNSRRMHKLVLSLLDISRLNTVHNYNIDFSMNDVIEKIEHDISLKIEEEKGQIYYDCLPKIHADRQRIESVFRNLLVNSLIYGGKKIEISYSHEIFKIEDDGIGIPKSQLERIFNPGERLKMNRAEGVGMGLTFCRKVIEQHNGSIWVESEGKEKGSAFYIKLPQNLYIKD